MIAPKDKTGMDEEARWLAHLLSAAYGAFRRQRRIERMLAARCRTPAGGMDRFIAELRHANEQPWPLLDEELDSAFQEFTGELPASTPDRARRLRRLLRRAIQEKDWQWRLMWQIEVCWGVSICDVALEQRFSALSNRHGLRREVSAAELLRAFRASSHHGHLPAVEFDFGGGGTT